MKTLVVISCEFEISISSYCVWTWKLSWVNEGRLNEEFLIRKHEDEIGMAFKQYCLVLLSFNQVILAHFLSLMGNSDYGQFSDVLWVFGAKSKNLLP